MHAFELRQWGCGLCSARAVRGVGAGEKHLETVVFFFSAPRLLLLRGARAVVTEGGILPPSGASLYVQPGLADCRALSGTNVA